MATILAPTDAALGQAVVSSSTVPARIRQALNVESGLNDGLALPLVLVAIALASVMDGAGTTSYWASFTSSRYCWGRSRDRCRVHRRQARRAWRPIALDDSQFPAAFGPGARPHRLSGCRADRRQRFHRAFTAGLTLASAANDVCGVLQEFAETEGTALGPSHLPLFSVPISSGLSLERSMGR